MKTFSIKEAVRTGWELFKQDRKNLILIALVFLIINNAGELKPIPDALEVILRLVLLVVGVIVNIGWIKTLLRVVDGGKAEFKELFRHGVLFFKYLGTLVQLFLRAGLPILVAVMVMTGLLAMPPSTTYQVLAAGVGILGFALTAYLGVKYQFALTLVIDKEISITESFHESARMTDGLIGKLFYFFIVLGLLNILGVVALAVGVLISIPTTFLAYLWVYRKLSSVS